MLEYGLKLWWNLERFWGWGEANRDCPSLHGRGVRCDAIRAHSQCSSLGMGVGLSEDHPPSYSKEVKYRFPPSLPSLFWNYSQISEMNFYNLEGKQKSERYWIFGKMAKQEYKLFIGMKCNILMSKEWGFQDQPNSDPRSAIHVWIGQIIYSL